MMRRHRSISTSPGELKVPDLFTVNNATKSISVGEEFSRRKINSLYGYRKDPFTGKRSFTTESTSTHGATR